MLALDAGIHCLYMMSAVDCLVKPDNDEELKSSGIIGFMSLRLPLTPLIETLRDRNDTIFKSNRSDLRLP